MHFALGADHAGRSLRQMIAAHLAGLGHHVVTLGGDAAKVDYPDVAAELVAQILAKQAERGILICGTGSGMAIAANRFSSIRAVVCTDEFVAEMARAHNDANVLCLGERVVGAGLALSIVNRFILTPYEGGRHQSRLDKLTALAK